jgi:hypothetical protein
MVYSLKTYSSSMSLRKRANPLNWKNDKAFQIVCTYSNMSTVLRAYRKHYLWVICYSHQTVSWSGPTRVLCTKYKDIELLETTVIFEFEKEDLLEYFLLLFKNFSCFIFNYKNRSIRNKEMTFILDRLRDG